MRLGIYPACSVIYKKARDLPCQQLSKFLADSVVMFVVEKKTKSVILTVPDVGYFKVNISDLIILINHKCTSVDTEPMMHSNQISEFSPH